MDDGGITIKETAKLIDWPYVMGINVGDIISQGKNFHVEKINGIDHTVVKTDDRHLSDKGHTISGDATVYAPIGAASNIGPVVIAKSAWTIEHPDHSSLLLPPGCYQVIYGKGQW